MPRLIVLLATLAVLLAGCGGGSGGGRQSHSVLAVSKAFYDAGLPFTGLVTGNPYVAGQVPFLPSALNASAVRYEIDAQLSESSTSSHSGVIAWVFDTDAHASAALKAVPLASWGQGAGPADRAVLGNVVVVAVDFAGAEKAKLDRALNALK
ncbi:MAG: hypothetical protein KGL94_06850 [Acidobacteriota bacterium]|nr:hypothetical protein [Acidobacteriota bacterium]